MKLPTFTATLIAPYPCTFCFGLGEIINNLIHENVPIGECPECHAERVTTLTIDVWAVWMLTPGNPKVPIVEVLARRRHPWATTRQWLRGFANEHVTAWGENSLRYAAYQAAIHALNGRAIDHLILNGRTVCAPGEHKVLYSVLVTDEPITWPEGWATTRRVLGGHLQAMWDLPRDRWLP